MRKIFLSSMLLSSAIVPSHAQYHHWQSPQQKQTDFPVARAVPETRSNLGGGLLEFMVRGETRRSEAPRPTYAALPPNPHMPTNAPMQMHPRFLPQVVSYDGQHSKGTVVIDTEEKFLYLVLGNGQARRYGVGVGRPGFEWKGAKTITRKAEWPDWTPPPQMLKRRPDLPKFMEGGEDNPMGARALYLGSSLFRIHGTNEPHTIGHAVSSGCFRMRNEDVIDLYGRVGLGTRVVVL